ncbi:MAG: PLP-dependent aminotransferase family protein [Bacteroidales bacterium]|jgi:2-aminoadipate transaminase|nr:PLP-dependent aminotransferase family protein [Bacteroidales bacterium]MDD3299886.1 PLP-dependent aminotransferase family protein [Bacteroidales bacterium]MDD3843218.1 PLP-dependent aminotransferase family protein [Bacteroidales bacterium]MDD4618065.1 PLP-dependent aminotransferase family protein [Bacteroidales bacterium]
MALNIQNILSDNAKSMRRSAIRDLLSVANRPEVISFAGGFPNPNTFPVEELKVIMQEVLEVESTSALQYGPTEGNGKLREILAQRYREQGLDITKNNILITTSSQQAIDLTSRIFISPEDTIVCGLPSYLGALQSFWSYQAKPIGVRKDEELEAVVTALIESGKKPKFIYTIPDFQNPSGVTMNMEQRKMVLDVAEKYDLLVIEDSPYREIRFEGEAQPLLYSMNNERVMLFGTLSKTVLPGFRIGWIIAPEQIIDRLVVAKQSADLCTPVFDQAVITRYFEKGLFEKNLSFTIDLYRKKRDHMLACFEKYMPQGVTWTRPEGGLFLFVTLPEGYDSTELFNVAIKENVAFVIGEAFHCDGSGKNTMRINFSFMDEEKTEEGVKRLAKAIGRMLNEGK